MKHNFFLACLIFVIVNLYSCECVAPLCQQAVQFTIVDRVTHQDLIFGSNPRYFIDTMLARTPADSLFSRIYRDGSSPTSTRLFLPLGDTVFLKLNQNDIDTLFITYINTGKTECCSHGHFDPSTVLLNGENVLNDGGKYLLKK